jgi:hypothetical protein
MSAAVGYPFEYFETFVGSLRRVYRGDVWLQINETVSADITEYLENTTVSTQLLHKISQDRTKKPRPEIDSRSLKMYVKRTGTICVYTRTSETPWFRLTRS